MRLIMHYCSLPLGFINFQVVLTKNCQVLIAVKMDRKKNGVYICGRLLKGKYPGETYIFGVFVIT